MNFRPWLVAMAVLTGGIFNIALLWFEDVSPPVVADAATVEIIKDLKINALTQAPGDRLQNLKEGYGLPEKMAKDANKRAQALLTDRGEQFEKILKDKAQDATQILCTKGDLKGDKLHGIYGVAEIIVVRGDDGSATVVADDFLDIERQPWFQGAPVGQVVKKVEATSARPADGTAMAIAAILIGPEGEKAVLADTYPWGKGGSWSMDNMLEQYANKNIKRKMIDYFAMASVLLEITHKENGLCR